MGKVAKFDETTVVVTVESKLRGDPGAEPLTFKFIDTDSGIPRVGKRYFIFSQGNDTYGKPKNEIQLNQSRAGQVSFTGWIMFVIEKREGKEYIEGALFPQERRAI